jgi:hypothetical protein
MRRQLPYVSLAIGSILLAASVLMSAGIWLEVQHRGWLAFSPRYIQWSSLTDFVVYGSLCGCMGALLLFDGIRELRCRAARSRPPRENNSN